MRSSVTLWAVGCLGSLFIFLIAYVGGSKASEDPLFGCPNSPLWETTFEEHVQAAAAFTRGDVQESREALTSTYATATEDVAEALNCSVGVAALTRLLAHAYCPIDDKPQDNESEEHLLHRYQVALRMLHLTMNFLTKAFATESKSFIDDSLWLITIQRTIDEERELRRIITTKTEGHLGHPPKIDVPKTFRDPKLSIGLVTLCSYPEGHLLPHFSIPNKEVYAERHGYGLIAETQRVHPTRPHAWGKIKLTKDAIKSGEFDWVVWIDCDSFIMDLSVTFDHLLYRYGADYVEDGHAGAFISRGKRAQISNDLHFLVSEDAAMINTGVYIIRASAWSENFLDQIWGDDYSPWITHPWWENAAASWLLLGDLPSRIINYTNDDESIGSSFGMVGIYPDEVVVMPQQEINSYHPITSRFQHVTYEKKHFILSFSGAPSGSSPTVMSHLYGNYHRLFCELNDLRPGDAGCVPVQDLPVWADT